MVSRRIPSRGSAPALRRAGRAFARCIALAAIGCTVMSASSDAPSAGAAADTRDIVHEWRRIYYGVLDGTPSLMFAEAIERAKPALGDLDGDGDLDLIVGTAQGRLLYFENQGTPKEPRWHLVNEALSALPAGPGVSPEDPQTVIRVGANAAPALVDIDGDGDLDLFVGSAEGKIAFYRNVGNAYLPVFRLESTDFLGAAFGQNVVPKFADVNADGLPDLALGNEAGEVWLLVNQGTRQSARLCAQPDPAGKECLTAPAMIVQLAGVDNAVPEWVDWNGDGLLDLMVGKSDGTLDYWWNIGTRTKPVWELKEPRFNILDAGGFSAPLFADVNGDGLTDLLLAADREQVQLYVGKLKDPKDRKAGAELWISDDNALAVRSLGGIDTRAHVAAGDLYGSGRADLVVGTASGQILVYENTGGKDAPSFRSAGGPLLPVAQRGFSAPAIADVDGDGVLDLVVGDRNGQLEWIKNAGTKKAPQWRAGGLFFGGIGVGALSVPLFADVDGDGLPDLLVGNSRGQVIYYRNAGSAAAPQFQLVGTQFGGMAVSGAASPALFAWNPGQPPDLVVGGQDGTLRSAVRVPGMPVTDRGAFLPLAAPWGNLRARGYSAPAFADLTGSGRPYLLVGTASGHVLLWRYEGNVARSEVVKAPARGLNVVADRTPAAPASDAGRGAPASDAGRGASASTPAPAPGSVAAAPEAALPPAPPPSLDPIFQEEPSELNKLTVGRGSKPAFIDVDGDGRPDMIVGTADGKLLHFQNLGPPENPAWKLVTSEFAGFHQGRNAAPAFVDIDGDGDLDLLVGTEDGQVILFENTGSAAQPRFVYRDDALKGLRAGKNAVPAGIELEPKGTQLVIGSLRGGLQMFRRKAGAALDYELADRRFLGIDLGVNTSPATADLTKTGHAALFVGTDKGPIAVLERTGTSPLRSSGWKANTTVMAGLTLPPGSHPALVDLDGDGDLDLVVGSDKGPLKFFRNNAIARGETALNAAPAEGRR